VPLSPEVAARDSLFTIRPRKGRRPQRSAQLSPLAVVKKGDRTRKRECGGCGVQKSNRVRVPKYCLPERTVIVGWVLR
jgi:hypothetical protein